MDRLDSSFFHGNPVDCARKIVGATLIWQGCAGRIVETEAYQSEGDPACHTFFRPSARSFIECHGAGTAYVYLNYGVHWLFNILVKGPAGQGFILLRALEPLRGIGQMVARRGQESPRDLCSGPGKLTQAFGIDGSHHGTDFLSGESTGLVSGPTGEIVSGPRIGISRGRDLPWRFSEAGNDHVSRTPGRPRT
jgi:DNA-3-methyladenine glycosylase